jgi:Bacterial protein of unknown function (DUF853)
LLDHCRAKDRAGGYRRQSRVEAMITSVTCRLGSQLGRQVIRGVLGSLLRHLKIIDANA